MSTPTQEGAAKPSYGDGFRVGARVAVSGNALCCMRGKPSPFRDFHGVVEAVVGDVVSVRLDWHPMGLSFRRSQLVVTHYDEAPR